MEFRDITLFIAGQEIKGIKSITYSENVCPECFSRSFTKVNVDIYACNGCFSRYTEKEFARGLKLVK